MVPRCEGDLATLKAWTFDKRGSESESQSSNRDSYVGSLSFKFGELAA